MRRSNLVWILAAGPLLAQQATQEPSSATVEVTATRFAEDPAKVPGSITVITGKELSDRGATDLRSALALTAGLNIAPGGDAGPASSVPEFWGLKEFDAFLLVVDGVPWGGTFNPALATLDLHDVERIEVQRGAAPVMYGATSFVGVIHVIHHQAADTPGSAEVHGGSHGSAGAAVALKLPKWAGFDSSLSADVSKQGFDDPDTGYKLGHLRWRNRTDLAGGSFHFDLDGSWLQQDPASPRPLGKSDFANQTPLDANHNPAGAHMNDRRLSLNLGYDRKLGSAIWTTTLGISRSAQNIFKGFLTDASNLPIDANGFREHIWLTDVYFDTHLAWTDLSDLKLVAGLDHMRGQGIGRGGDFDYVVNLDGSNRPGDAQLPPAKDARIDDNRNFSGLYGFAEWTPVPRLVLEAGVRLNHTDETRSVWNLDYASNTLDGGNDSKTNTRLSGSVGLTWSLWQADQDRLNLFANYKNTFKPGAIDFGMDSNFTILKPETAESYELGLKGAFSDGRYHFELDAFQMDFENVVVTQNGVLVNAGKERFKGVEGELSARLTGDFSVRTAYSYHDARFLDYVQDFGGTPTQLAGNRLEMSAFNMASVGVIYAPAQGFLGTVEASYVGPVYLNKRNTVPSGGYSTLAASAGYRHDIWEVRLTGRNLTDKRNPVAESEMGDAQYYLNPGRRFDLSLSCRF